MEDRANAILEANLAGVKRMPFAEALKSPFVALHDYVTPYVDDLKNVLDMEAIKQAGIKIGVDPLGGSGVAYWDVIAKTYGLNIEVVNYKVDPTFSFMTLDKDGKIRMDCSSPFAMASLIALRTSSTSPLATTLYDRHGIVTKSGLMNPNHYLAVAIQYLFTHRTGWSKESAVGKTLVSSSMIDRVAGEIGRTSKRCRSASSGLWMASTAASSALAVRSAGASFLRKDGTVWTTDKDGFILALLAAEILAVTGKDPQAHYDALEAKFGRSSYRRIDAPANSAQKAVLSKLDPALVEASTLAGEPIIAKLTKAPGNDAAIGGLKVVTENAGSRRALRHRVHLQDLHGELQGRGAPGPHPAGSPADRLRRPGQGRGLSSTQTPAECEEES